MRLPLTFLLVSFFYILFLLATNAHSKVLCIEKEKQALLDFKLSFVGDPLGSLPSWSIDIDDCCAWEGVECANYTGHVTSLIFGEFLTSYKLRPSLVELQHLSFLDLSQNRFPMRIPEFIGSLGKLTSLDLSESGFFGEIPPHLGNLSRLQYLDLSLSNGLYAHSLHWLSRLSSIEYLVFKDVSLSTATDWVSSIKMLHTLARFDCQSCSLPPPPLSFIPHVNFSTSLQYLDLSINSVSSSTFSYLINGNSLRRLSLDYMKLEYSLDPLLEALTVTATDSLEKLSLAGNNLSKLPFEVMMFPSLTSLDVSLNRISESLLEILQYLPRNLTSLDLSANFLSGVISDAHFSKFLKLEKLKLSNNNLLQFNFSKGWMPPFQLQSLRLGSCMVGPSFPYWILTQKKLYDLDISSSMISGAIPDDFWHFSTGLLSLNLSHNKINCNIPNLSLSFGFNADIDLSYNAIHGSIPFFLFTTWMLDLSKNKFSSFHPFHPRVLSGHTFLINLSSNRLSGTLPNWLFQFDILYVLNLENNMLSGTLPREIGPQCSLFVLHLSNNRLSGQLPLSMKNCTRLTILELANNKLSGVVPFWLGERMPNLIALTFRSNNFFGDLPSTLCHLRSLQILDLSNNKLSGCIPGCVHNFTTMSTDKTLSLQSVGGYQLYTSYTNDSIIALDYASVMWKGVLADMYSRSLDQRNVIDLSGNRLSGEIPIGVTTLKELRSLDLSRNDLNGSIPDKIGQLTLLEVLRLSSNRLSGEIPRSLAALNFLNTLNLSNNNLSGRIPKSTQLQSFDPSSFAGNPKLCGEPLPTECPGDEVDDKKQPRSSKDAHDDQPFDTQAFLAALGMGFAFSFLAVLSTLHFIRPWRIAFFQMGDNIADRTFVATSLFQSRIKRSLCFKKANGDANM